ncbi:MAG: LamG domain-containing protein, partial [Candidatus Brocadiales bacterium]|nr:LamG domain-containing protein [Candidatus Brocadiales bacterium]
MIRQLTNNNAKLSLASAPTIGDRTREGKIWIKKDTNEAYILLDVTAGVATWDKLVTASGYLPMDTMTDPALDSALTTAKLDAYSGVIILTTGAGNDQTFDAPTDTTPGKRYWVINDDSSTHSFNVVGARTITIDPGEAEQYMYDGTAWIHITAADAEDITYNPATSYLTDTNVQSAFDAFAPTTSGILEVNRALVPDASKYLNFDGGYLLNDQTTTNMMSKGTVYRFDGVDDVITVPYSAVFEPINNLTINALVSRESIGSYHTIASEYDTDSDNRGWNLSFTNGDVLEFAISKDGTGGANLTVLQTTETFTTLDEPMWVTATYQYVTDGTSVMNIYVNGVLLATTSTAVGAINATGEDLLLGAVKLSGSNARFFHGTIAHQGIFNLTATAAEVKDLISGNIPFKWVGASQ